MGGMGSTGGRSKTGLMAGPYVKPTANNAGQTGLSTEFEANKPQIMPTYNSPSQVEAAKRKRQEIISRSGRGSTNLVGNPGTRAYQSSFLGSVV